ncbi:CDP-glycerol glycerophosphotransferase family protein [Microbacterium sp. bgisy189]|uniref:CDP-glycerol glycerophosphotransferase family protein n=1 Tax=Microbacterium sp. bgisy189 TaxID=3413798 RepID=UPI003EBC1A7D
MSGAGVEVVSITWERIHMTVHVRLSSPPADADESPSTVAFSLVDGDRSFPTTATAKGGGNFAITINVTTFADRAAIPDGNWRVEAQLDPSTTATYVGDLADLDDASRVFLHDGGRAALTVSFSVEEHRDDPSRLDLLIRSNHLRRAAPAKRARRLPARIRSRLLGAGTKQKYVRAIYRLASRLFGPRTGRVLFASDQQPTMEGNLLRVHERMLERGLDDRFDLRSSFRLPATTGWLRTARILYLMATSEIILLDDYFGLLNTVTIDPRTRVIQLWHAGSGFKSVGFSRFGSTDSPSLRQPHRQYTYAISGSEHLRHVYAEAFGIEEAAIVPTGLPRIDWFLDETRTTAFKASFAAQYPHLQDKRIILFAPTFRGASYHSASYDFGLIDFDALAAACPPDTVVLFRMHHFVKERIEIPDRYRDRFFDFTDYPDGLGLLHVTDLLITDYSSIIYEFALLDRPMLFFAPDKTVYAATRGFHRAYEQTAPGRVCETFEQLTQAIRTGDFEVEKLARFRAENFDRIDTGAADRVIDWLILDEYRGSKTALEAEAP